MQRIDAPTNLNRYGKVIKIFEIVICSLAVKSVRKVLMKKKLRSSCRTILQSCKTVSWSRIVAVDKTFCNVSSETSALNDTTSMCYLDSADLLSRDIIDDCPSQYYCVPIFDNPKTLTLQVTFVLFN